MDLQFMIKHMKTKNKKKKKIEKNKKKTQKTQKNFKKKSLFQKIEYIYIYIHNKLSKQFVIKFNYDGINIL